MSKIKTQELKRTIGTGALGLSVVNMTIGAGIFVVPGVVAAGLGPASFVAYLMCAGLMILVMLCFAEVGSKITTSGGSYAYVENAFGPYAGFLINTLFWFGYAIVADAAIANAMADMIGTMFPLINEKLMRIVFFVVLFGFFGYINSRGTKSGTRLMVINTLVKLVPLLVLVDYGIFNIETGNLTIDAWPPIEKYGEMALILFFAFGGAESALGNSGDIINPQKTIPRGIFLGLISVLVIYLLIQTVAQGVLGALLPSHADAPLAQVAQVLMGNFGYQLVLIGAIISIYGTLSGDVLATSRLIFAGAKDKIYPPIFGKLHPKYQTPTFAIGLFVGLLVVLASSGEFKQLALIASSATLIIYLAVALATIKIRLRDKDAYPNSFKLPLGYTIPIVACTVVLWFLSHITIDEVLALCGFFLLSSLFFWFYSRKKIH
ncbi:MAG: amino acid permease [Cyclobacteriaceae bacterium]